MPPKISVIVPVYNGEKYIEENAENILSQHFKDFELIYVNDGSNDDSLRKIEQIKDKRVRYINQANEGASKARMTGVKNAQGEFISFIDVDDIIKEDYLEKLYACADEHTDMICCNAIEAGSVNSGSDIKNDEIISSKKDLFSAYFQKKRFSITLWAKIIRRNLLCDLSPAALKYSEDEYLNLSVFCKARQVTLIPYTGYIYKFNENSLMSKSTAAERVRDLAVTTEYAYDCVKRLCPEIIKTAAVRLNECLFAVIYRIYAFTNKEERQAFRDNFLRIYKKIEENDAFIGMKGKLVKLYFKHENVACKALKILYKIQGEAK